MESVLKSKEHAQFFFSSSLIGKQIDLIRELDKLRP